MGAGFWASLFESAFNAFLTDIGTSALGWIQNLFIPLVVVFFLVRNLPKGQTRESQKQGLIAPVGIFIGVCLVFAALVVLVEVSWRQPHRIYREASLLPPSIWVSRPPRPPAADELLTTRPSRPQGTVSSLPAVSVAPVAVPPPPAVQPPQRQDNSGMDALNTRIQMLIATLWGWDRGYAGGAGIAARQYDRHGQGQSPDIWIKSAQERARNRDATYHDLQPQITSLRHDIQVALKLTPQQIETDDYVFEALNAKAQIPTPVPTSLDTDNDQAYKFLDVRKYFADLNKKLGYTLPNEDRLLEGSFSGYP